MGVSCCNFAPPPWTCETGAICQIGVLNGAYKSPSLPTMFVSKCYKTKHFGQDSPHKKPKLRRRNLFFTVLKWGKGENTMKATIWATIIENVVRKGREQTHFSPKCARFPGENANLTNGTHFTHTPPPTTPSFFALPMMSRALTSPKQWCMKPVSETQVSYDGSFL